MRSAALWILPLVLVIPSCGSQTEEKATYTITAPNGRTYTIEGPIGATRREVMAEVMRRDPMSIIPSRPRRGSGHQAGYDWANQNDVLDPYDCGGRSQSFIEGCQEFANQYQSDREAEADYNERELSDEYADEYSRFEE